MNNWQDKMKQFVETFLNNTYNQKYSIKFINDNRWCVLENEVVIWDRTSDYLTKNHWQTDATDSINDIHAMKLKIFKQKHKCTNY